MTIPRTIFVVEGAGSSIECAFRDAGKALKYCRETFGVTFPRGSVNLLNSGDFVSVEDPEDFSVVCVVMPRTLY
jgi:hypothetical protein